MAAGICRCLLLTKCLSLVVSLSLVQTVPPYSVVCPGDRLVFTCTASPGADIMSWRGHSGKTYHIQRNNYPLIVDGFNITSAQVNGLLVSNATNDSVPLELNGTSIGCSDDSGVSYTIMTIHVADVPEAVTNIKINPVHSNAIFINWATSGSCIHYYVVTIISNTLTHYRRTGNTNITVDTLIIGTNYSFIITPIDTIGREGPPSSLIQYIWNVPAQVVNIEYMVSTDSIIIWWNNNQVYSTTPVPPTQYYIINVYNTSNSIIYNNNTNNTNINITGLSLTDTVYTVTIIPVNIIGYGPSTTLNVSIKNHSFSSTSMILSTIESDTMMSSTVTTTEYITMSMCDTIPINPALTVFSIVTVTTTFPSVTTRKETSTTFYAPCVSKASNAQSADRETISVAIAVPIMTGLSTGLITAVITSIIVYCIMKRRRNKTIEVTQEGVTQEGPIYDLPVVNTEQKPKPISTYCNAAYGQINI